MLPGPGISIPRWLSVLFMGVISASALAGYKPKPWSPRAAETYPARMTSERVTIAAEPLILDAQAAQVFDKNDVVTAGIMPLAIVVFNDNDFPVRVEAATIELILSDEHLHTLMPREAVAGLFRKGKHQAWGVPSSRESGNPAALSDFGQKFLGRRIVPPHGRDGGFLYIHPHVTRDFSAYVSGAKVYIPEIYREDNGSRMIFFEFELRPAFAKAADR